MWLKNNAIRWQAILHRFSLRQYFMPWGKALYVWLASYSARNSAGRDPACLLCPLFAEENVDVRSPVFHSTQQWPMGSQIKAGGRERSNTVLFSSSAHSQWTCRLSVYKTPSFLCLHEVDIQISNEDRSHKEWESYSWPDPSHNLANTSLPKRNCQHHCNRKQCHRKKQQVSGGPYNIFKWFSHCRCSMYHFWETTSVHINLI